MRRTATCRSVVELPIIEIETLDHFPVGRENRTVVATGHAGISERLRRLVPSSPVPPATDRTFTRLVDVDGRTLSRTVRTWWRLDSSAGQIEVCDYLVLTDPRHVCDTWSFQGRLRVAPFGRGVPVDIALWPHLGSWTKLSLHPRSAIRPSRRYVRRGHGAIEALIAALKACPR